MQETFARVATTLQILILLFLYFGSLALASNMKLQVSIFFLLNYMTTYNIEEEFIIGDINYNFNEYQPSPTF